MANSLPMTLRVYQKLSAAVVPLAPALIKRRLKQGKEDPARVSERRGMSRDIRPLIRTIGRRRAALDRMRLGHKSDSMNSARLGRQ